MPWGWILPRTNRQLRTPGNSKETTGIPTVVSTMTVFSQRSRRLANPITSSHLTLPMRLLGTEVTQGLSTSTVSSVYPSLEGSAPNAELRDNPLSHVVSAEVPDNRRNGTGAK